MNSLFEKIFKNVFRVFLKVFFEELISTLTCKAARGSAPFGRLSIGCKKTDVISVKSIDFDFSRSPLEPESSY